MLRDDAIRAGRIKPTKGDIERMNLKEVPLPLSDQVFDTADEGEGIRATIDFEDLTYKELARKAEKMGIELPTTYIKKDALIKLIQTKL